MNKNTNPLDLRNFVISGDLDGGMHLLNAQPYIEDVQDFLPVLMELGKTENEAVKKYFLAQAHYRLDHYEQAYECFVAAADNGLFSGYFRAAQLLRDHPDVIQSGVSSSYSPSSLFSMAADQGHVWSKLVVLRGEAGGSWLMYARYLFYRFAGAPWHIVRFSLSRRSREKIRY